MPYILFNPDKSQAVLMGDTQADGYVPAQIENPSAAVQVTARTQAEFDATIAKRKGSSGGGGNAGTSAGYTGTINLNPK